MKLLYVNVYAVTRHYGGPEEGGWWTNAGDPLASTPVPAQELPGHEPNHCRQCDKARNEQVGSKEKPGNDGFCVETPDDEFMESSIRDLISLREQRQEPINEDEIRQEYLDSNLFKSQCKMVTHLAPLDEEELETTIDKMTKCFEDQKEGNIYSVLGGTDIQVKVQEHQARHWPEETPRYE